MSEGKLDHLTNFGELLSHTTNIVISDIFGLLLVITVDGITFIEECGLRRDNTVLGRVHVDDLELDGAETTTNNECISLLDRSVTILEVGNEISLRDTTRDAFN